MSTLPEPTPAQVERQIQIEQTYKEDGIKRSRKAVQLALSKGRASELPEIHRIMGAALNTVAARIDEEKGKKVAGRYGKYRVVLRSISTDVLASLALTEVLNRVSTEDESQSSLQSVCAALGRLVYVEHVTKRLEVRAPAYLNKVREYLKERNTKSQSHILRTIRAAAMNLDCAEDIWPNNVAISVGSLLLAAVMDTGLFIRRQHHRNSLIYIEPCPEMLEKFDEILEHADGMVHNPPMIVPPVPHYDSFSGGYLTNVCHRKTYANRHLPAALRRRVYESFDESPLLREAFTKAQEVGYRINSRIFALLQEARTIGFDKGMPSHHVLKKPDFPIDEAKAKDTWDEKEKRAFEDWKLQTREWHSDENKRRAQVRAMATSMEIAADFVSEPRIYFPTCADWRWRMYFKSTFNPQGNDAQKALVEYADGKALGERGLFWLKSHIATCYGFDKKHFNKRAQWTDERIKELREWVIDPLNYTLFDDADSYWCMLAAAIELDEAMKLPDPTKFVSRVIVAVDATNSGGQHFSAQLRDPVGGEYTNLTWKGNDAKADLYMLVKTLAEQKLLCAPRDTDDALVKGYWRLNPLTRGMTKRPTMTYFYAATERSCTKYLLGGAKDEGYEPLEEASLFWLSAKLTPYVRAGIEEAMPAAAACMRYISQLCRAIPVENHLEWKTALGGLIINRYPALDESKVTITSMNKIQLTCRIRNHDITNRRKNASGGAPNYTHGQDSTHLAMTVLGFDGCITPIHDSFGSHACDIDSLQRVIREQFVRLYTDFDILKQLRIQALIAGADLTDIPHPVQGNLNLNDVLDSPFFFC